MSVTIKEITTPLGHMTAGATDDGLCLLEFSDRQMLNTQKSTLEKRLKMSLVSGNHPHLAETEKQLREYFSGQRKTFDLPLIYPGTPFQQKAWDALLQIPYGTTRSYKQQADAVGDVKSVRAVARANGENRLAIIIPCHRIIGADGGAVGYGGGVERKRWLLKHEYAHC